MTNMTKMFFTFSLCIRKPDGVKCSESLYDTSWSPDLSP